MIGKFLKLLLLVAIFNYGESANTFQISFTRASVNVIITDFYNRVEYKVVRDGKEIQSVILGTGSGGALRFRQTAQGGIISGRGDEIEFRRDYDERDYSQFSVMRRNIRKSTQDCVDLGTKTDTHWIGGNQQLYQYWPVQKLVAKHVPYLTLELQARAITERYWLNSNGLYFYVDLDVPLFLDQNNEYIGFMCLEAKRSLPYDTRKVTFDFTYKVGVGRNSKDTHLQAIKRYLKKPTGYPDERMVRDPVWSTWARYKIYVDNDVVIKFANEVKANGFKNSQLEIDDEWEDCYGALTFRKSKFPNIKSTTDALKALGFRVTLWIHPFINSNCEPWHQNAVSKGYLVKDHNNNTKTLWWDSRDGITAGYVDFTKTEVANWFLTRLNRLRDEDGIDSFKFDAGESSWVPKDPVLNSTSQQYPHIITQQYVRTVAKMGNMVEVRTGQNTQDLPIFVRMIDKDSEWSLRNGLPTLITTLLQMNMAGYPLVLPDMVAGNGYTSVWGETVLPSPELFIRWLQANTFMPALQFSFVPWDYDAETIAISHKFVDLHAQYTPLIMERFKLAVNSGEPVNPPIWWVDPTDKIAQSISDQFMLGDTILVAPVIVEKAVFRDVYLPAGTWKDGNSDTIYTGRQTITYPAPLNTLPYFIKQ